MKVDRSAIKGFYNLVEKISSLSDLVEFLHKRILIGAVRESVLENKISMMMARKPPDQWNSELANEYLAQVRLALWILGPVWFANGNQLPEVNLRQFEDKLSNEASNDWDKYYSQFGDYDPLWQDIINDNLMALKISSSRIIVGRITRIFLETLPEPILVS